MLAIRVDLLTGRYVATAHTDRTRAEWPIHPARLFSALVAALHLEHDVDPAERDVLNWMSTLDAPALSASPADHRGVVPVFVPVNDPSVHPDFAALLDDMETASARLRAPSPKAAGGTSASVRVEKAVARLEKQFSEAVARGLQPATASTAALETAAGVLPEGRSRQPRTFPSVTPERPVVHFVWPDASPTTEQGRALGRLLARVSRIGHSSSLVGCRLVEDPPPVNWVPDASTRDLSLRWVAPGQLERLEAEYERHREEQPHVLPSRSVSYRDVSQRAAETVPVGVFGQEWIVFRRIDGSRLPGRRAPDLAEALRKTLMAHSSQQPAPLVLSGHKADDSKAESPRPAVLALPNVGHRHADGTILGVAIVLPRGISPEDRAHVERGVANWERAGTRQEDGSPPRVSLWKGPGVELRVQRQDPAWLGRASLKALDPATWARCARRWVSVTPVALDRNPGQIRSRRPEVVSAAVQEAEETISRACTLTGLPRPMCVTVSLHSLAQGAEPVFAYAPWPAKREGRFQRVLVHAELLFETAVAGPVILGAGRYAGLGLFRAVE